MPHAPILLVEDDPAGGRLLLATLATEGFTGHLESTGRGALAAASRTGFGATVVDGQLTPASAGGLDDDATLRVLVPPRVRNVWRHLGANSTFNASNSRNRRVAAPPGKPRNPSSARTNR